MNENLNLVEILKDCPKGTKLYSPVYEYVELVSVSLVECAKYPIEIKDRYGVSDDITKDGRIYEEFQGECMLFPNKEQRDWNKFNVPNHKKAKFDPKTLKPFDKVLVRFGLEYDWECTLFSHFVNDFNKFDDTFISYYVCGSTRYKYCIPYNDDTKHLVGTNKEAPEFYRYWE